jgi:hypothetical protein
MNLIDWIRRLAIGTKVVIWYKVALTYGFQQSQSSAIALVGELTSIGEDYVEVLSDRCDRVAVRFEFIISVYDASQRIKKEAT